MLPPIEALQLEIDLARHRARAEVLARHTGEQFSSSHACPNCGACPMIVWVQPVGLRSQCCGLAPQPEPLA